MQILPMLIASGFIIAVGDLPRSGGITLHILYQDLVAGVVLLVQGVGRIANARRTLSAL